MTDWTFETLAAELVRVAPDENCEGCAPALYNICNIHGGEEAACRDFAELLERVQTAERKRGEE